MTKELKEFFQRLEKENPYDYFLLKKLYYSPNSIFSDSKDYVDVGFYYDEDLVYKYMFNNNLLEFLCLAYDDEDFLNKLNYYMLLSLEELLNKSIEITFITRENDFTYKGIYTYIKSRLENKNLYKDKTIINKIKKYNLDFADDILERTDDIIYIYELSTTTNNNEASEDNNKNIIYFPKLK